MNPSNTAKSYVAVRRAGTKFQGPCVVGERFRKRPCHGVGNTGKIEYEEVVRIERRRARTEREPGTVSAEQDPDPARNSNHHGIVAVDIECPLRQGDASFLVVKP